MDTFRKVQVLCVFMTGAVVLCAFGLVRVITLAGLEPGDPSYNMAWPGIWSFAEEAIGIMAACLPTMGGYLTKKRVTSITYSVQALLSSSKRKSRMGTSIINSTTYEEHDSTQKGGASEPVVEMDRLSGNTMGSTESMHQVPKNVQDGRAAGV